MIGPGPDEWWSTTEAAAETGEGSALPRRHCPRSGGHPSAWPRRAVAPATGVRRTFPGRLRSPQQAARRRRVRDRRPSATRTQKCCSPTRSSNVAWKPSAADGSNSVLSARTRESTPRRASPGGPGAVLPHRPRATMTGSSSWPRPVSSYTRALVGGGNLRLRTIPLCSSSRSRWARTSGLTFGSPTAVVATAVRLGGAVVAPSHGPPDNRVAVLADPQGAVFAISKAPPA